MKRLARLLAVTLSIALVITSVGFGNLTTVHAKGNVKSVKVKGAKKKMTFKVGDVKTYKVKVKAKKGKTKFSVKSSNKKVVAAKKKGKKIILIALSVGKAKVTVKSKSNKKKKYVININVVSGTAPKTTTTKKIKPTVAPTTAEQTVAPTTEPVPTVAPTTTVGPTTTKADVTTTAKTPTTAEPTTPKDTTTAEPTTPKVTTTAAPTTTTEETTTEESSTQEETTSPIPRPTEVEGFLVTAISSDKVTFTWSQNDEQALSGQVYNVYLDGAFFYTYSAPENVTINDLSDGVHTIKVTAFLNDFETVGVSENLIIQIPTTEAPTETTTPEETTSEQETTEKELDMHMRCEDNSIGIYFDQDISDYEIDKSNILIQTKDNEQDDYSHTIEDYSLTKYSGSIIIDPDERIKGSAFVKVEITINGKTYTEETTSYYSSWPIIVEKECEFNLNSESGTLISIGDNGVGEQTIEKITGLPDGVSCNIINDPDLPYGLYIFGTITNPGVYFVTVDVKDEMNCDDTYNVTIFVSNNENIAASAKDRTHFVYASDEDINISSGTVLKVRGGSGSYNFEILENTQNVFDTDIDANNPVIHYTINNRGTYKVKIKITDRNNNKLSTTVNATVIVRDYYKVTGKVTDEKGRPVSNVDIRLYDYYYGQYIGGGYSDENGNYEMEASDEKCYVSASIGTVYQASDGVIFKDDCVYNLVINNINKVTMDYDVDKYGIIGWYVHSGYYGLFCGKGRTIYLKEGYNEVEGYGLQVIDGKLYNIFAEVTVKVNGDTQLTPTIKIKQLPMSELFVGKYNMSNLSRDEKYFKFVAPKTGDYSFTSEFGFTEDGYRYDTGMTLYDSKMNEIDHGSDGYDYEGNDFNFRIVHHLEEGKTYYISLSAYSYEDLLGRFIIAEED